MSTVEEHPARLANAGAVRGWLHEWLPDPLLTSLRWGMQWALPVAGVRVPVYVLRGTAVSNGAAATVVLAGDLHWGKYLPSLFLSGDYVTEPAGSAWVWDLPRVLRKLGESADMTVARLDRVSARCLFGDGHVHVPEFAGTILAPLVDPHIQAKASTSLKEDLRIMRAERLHIVPAREMNEFDYFYDEMYARFLWAHHGPHAIVRDKPSLRRYFRRGTLWWACRDGERLGAVAFDVVGNTVYSRAIGYRSGLARRLRGATTAALYYYVIKMVIQERFAAADFGGVRPLLSDGVLRYKRKWGMGLCEYAGSLYDLVLGWRRVTPALAAFLSQHPLIVRDGIGFSALAAATDPEQAEALRRKFWMPGLRRLHLALPE